MKLVTNPFSDPRLRIQTLQYTYSVIVTPYILRISSWCIGQCRELLDVTKSVQSWIIQPSVKTLTKYEIP